MTLVSRIRVLLCALVVVALSVAGAAAERRLAMVIGNGAYDFATELKNPANDAAAMAAALERLGFEVLLGTDMTHAQMRKLIRDFGTRAANADVGLFFYAGHGIQVAGRNYILPVDANLESENDLDFAAIDADLIQRQMDRGPGTRLIFLDACRDNPFERPLARSMGATRSSRVLGRGLARIEASGGALVAFATDPGDVAADGTGQNSPFTNALLAHIETPGLEINVMLTRVRADVFAATKARQRPWTSSSLIGEVYLAPKAGSDASDPVPSAPAAVVAALPAAPANNDAQEIAVWTSAEGGGTAADYRAYLNQYPAGAFAEMARNRLAALETARPEPEPEPEPGPTPAPEQQAAPQQQPQAAPTPAPAPADNAVELALWQAAQSNATAPAYQAYLDQFPDGLFAPLARKLIADLERPAPGADAPATTATDPEPQETQTAALSPQEAEAALALDRAARREVQERLSVAGFDPRGLDGIFGPGTRGALRGWQGKAGRAATGYLSADDLAALEAQTDAGLPAFREKLRREAAAAAAKRKRKPSSSGTTTQRTGTSGSLYRATSSCRADGVSATARHADRQQAMLAAARACAARGGSPSCCTANISVSR